MEEVQTREVIEVQVTGLEDHPDIEEDMETIAQDMAAQLSGITLMATAVLIRMTTMDQVDIATKVPCMEVTDTTKVVAMEATAMTQMGTQVTVQVPTRIDFTAVHPMVHLDQVAMIGIDNPPCSEVTITHVQPMAPAVL